MGRMGEALTLGTTKAGRPSSAAAAGVSVAEEEEVDIIVQFKTDRSTISTVADRCAAGAVSELCRDGLEKAVDDERKYP